MRRAVRVVSSRVEVVDDLKTDPSRRTIELPADVVDWLADHRTQRVTERLSAEAWRDERLMFASPTGNVLYPSNVRHQLAAICEAAGVPMIRPNALRHSCASLLSDIGVPNELIADLLGYTSARMVDQTYRHRLRDRRHRRQRRLDDRLGGSPAACPQRSCGSSRRRGIPASPTAPRRRGSAARGPGQRASSSGAPLRCALGADAGRLLRNPEATALPPPRRGPHVKLGDVIKPRRRLAGCLASAAILGVSGVVAGTAPQASAQQALSAGCTNLDAPFVDGFYGGASLGTRQYLAGEVITVSAGEPTVGGPPTATRLVVNSVLVASGGFPATLSYTVPADGPYAVAWGVNLGAATWNVSCTPPLACLHDHRYHEWWHAGRHRRA